MVQEEGENSVIQTVASLCSPDQFDSDQIREASAVEIRLDLMRDLTKNRVEHLAETFHGPIILTLRSRAEGGEFDGDADSWMNRIIPFLPLVTMVDVEIRFREHACHLKDLGITVIASCHRNEMLSPAELDKLYLELRSFGDIPKIAVRPRDTSDLLTLLDFTHTAGKPVIISVTGIVCRYARPLLPLFGSLFTYCYIDKPTSPGQYSLQEMKILSRLLSPAIMDTWFDGKPECSGNSSHISGNKIVR